MDPVPPAQPSQHALLADQPLGVPAEAAPASPTASGNQGEGGTAAIAAALRQICERATSAGAGPSRDPHGMAAASFVGSGDHLPGDAETQLGTALLPHAEQMNAAGGNGDQERPHEGAAFVAEAAEAGEERDVGMSHPSASNADNEEESGDGAAGGGTGGDGDANGVAAMEEGSPRGGASAGESEEEGEEVEAGALGGTYETGEVRPGDSAHVPSDAQMQSLVPDM